MGKVILTVRNAAQAAGLENPFALARATGIGYAICHRMWSGTQTRIDLATLARLCEALKCQPGDLLFYGTKASRKE